jgi:hypothetical protein
MRQIPMKRRADACCSTWHNIIDPIGFGLENSDWMGRWRNKENDKPVDATASMSSGGKFDGPVELRQVLLKRKDEFVRHLTGKVLGYALGHSLEPALQPEQVQQQLAVSMSQVQEVEIIDKAQAPGTPWFEPSPARRPADGDQCTIHRLDDTGERQLPRTDPGSRNRAERSLPQ